MLDKSTALQDTPEKRIGAQLKARRVLAGFSQEKLADALGVTFQQVQKYENGANRISASRLFTIAKILNTPVSTFANEAYAPSLSIAETQSPLQNNSEEESIPADILTQKETLDILKAYYAIENEDMRKKALDILKTFSK